MTAVVQVLISFVTIKMFTAQIRQNEPVEKDFIPYSVEKLANEMLDAQSEHVII